MTVLNELNVELNDELQSEMLEFTDTQKNRLIELWADETEIAATFNDAKSRNQQFAKLEKKLVAYNKEILDTLLTKDFQTKLTKLKHDLEQAFCKAGFAQMETPTIISRKFLERMSIDGTHPLNEQVFWLDNKSCLRPMLAPNLYDVSKSLLNVADLPLKVFEVGSCFRKESEGRSHLKEFTMLNVVEWGTPLENREQRLKEMATLIMEAAGITDYTFEDEESVVYGEGLDLIGLDGLELASSSMGPHPLDSAWGITTSWVGIGVGLERLLMYREKANGIHRFSKSIAYLNGARLNIK